MLFKTPEVDGLNIFYLNGFSVFRSFEQRQNVVPKRGPAVAFGGSPAILPLQIAGAVIWLTHLPPKSRGKFRPTFRAGAP
jgi:hypothetical protein